MVEIKINGIESIKNAVLFGKDNEKYYKEAQKKSIQIKEDLENNLQYLNGNVTLLIAIPYIFFQIIKINGEIKNQISESIYKLSPNLNNWIV